MERARFVRSFCMASRFQCYLVTLVNIGSRVMKVRDGRVLHGGFVCEHPSRGTLSSPFSPFVGLPEYTLFVACVRFKPPLGSSR